MEDDTIKLILEACVAASFFSGLATGYIAWKNPPLEYRVIKECKNTESAKVNINSRDYCLTYKPELKLEKYDDKCGCH